MSNIEIVGFISSLLAVWLTVKQNRFCWFWNILSAGIYALYFYEIKLLADSLLQFFFIGISVYGWINWQRDKVSLSNQSKFEILLLSKKVLLFLIFFVLITTFAVGTFFSKSTSASIPYLDSFCFSLSIAATVLAALKYLESWLIWIFVDVIYVGMYLFKGAYLTAFLYLIFIVLAINGLSKWKKTIRLTS